MATSYTTTIKNLKPQGWSRQTVADGQALNNSFLEPTHQKDLKLAEGLDATNDRIDSVNTQMTTLGQRVSNAETTVANIGEEVQTYDQKIAQLNSNLQIVSAAEGELATSLGTVTEKLNEHKDLVSVDSTTIAGDGSAESPYTVIGGGGGGGVSKVYVPNVDDGNLSYTLSAASAAESQIGPWDIKGPKGEDGAPGVGLSAELIQDQYNKRVEVKIWEKNASEPDATAYLPYGESPVVIATPFEHSETDPEGHTNGGTKIEFKYGNTLAAEYSAWNGNDGAGATVTLHGGNGIEIENDGTSYTATISGGVYVSSLSAGSAYKAGYSELAGSATYAEKFKVDNTDYTFSNLYSEVDTLSNASGRWDAHSALSAAKLDKSIWDGNSGKFLQTVSTNTTVFSGDGTSQTPLDLKINNPNSTKKYGYQPGTGWTEITEGGGGGTDYDIVGNNGISAKKDTANEIYEVGLSAKFLQTVSADTNTLSGNGTSGSPLGIDSNNLYELDTAGSYLSSQTVGQKTLISTTPALDNAVQKVIDEADTWDTVSAKSVVTINKATNEIKINNNANSAISAAIYDVCNTSELALIPQRLIVGTSSGDFVTYVNGGKCNGQGTLFFWLESMQPWVPVNN